jgi:hypothetical protein
VEEGERAKLAAEFAVFREDVVRSVNGKTCSGWSRESVGTRTAIKLVHTHELHTNCTNTLRHSDSD